MPSAALFDLDRTLLSRPAPLALAASFRKSAEESDGISHGTEVFTVHDSKVAYKRTYE